MRLARMTGLGVYLPEKNVPNAELAALDRPMTLEQLDQTGILARRHASDDETSLNMGMCAARQALAEAHTEASELDFVILANWSDRRYVPDLAPALAYGLGAKRAFAHDLCGACCGFVLGLSVATGYLSQGRYRRGLVVAADRSSRRMRPGSRATLVFGDAAAAAVVDTVGESGFRLRDFELRSSGEHHDIMVIDEDGYLDPRIRQRELNVLAGTSMAAVASALLDRNGMTLDDVDFVVPHSGTAGVQLQLREHLGVPNEKVLTNLPLIGNVTTASIPCSLHHFRQLGRLSHDHTVLSVAVGLGWQSVAMLLSP